MQLLWSHFTRLQQHSEAAAAAQPSLFLCDSLSWLLVCQGFYDGIIMELLHMFFEGS